MDEDYKKDVANFRFGLIAPLVTRKLAKGERQKILTELAKQTFLTPQGECKKVRIRTLERFVALYEKDGMQGLLPKDRKDVFRSRTIEPDLLAKAVP